MPRCIITYLGFIGVSFVLSCGPVEYLSYVSGRAALLLSQARYEGAESKAPYEFTKAQKYLDFAREDAGRGCFQSAIEWGRRSQDCARRALALIKADSSKQTASISTRPQQMCGGL